MPSQPSYYHSLPYCMFPSLSSLTSPLSENNSAMLKTFRGNNTSVSSLVGIAILVGVLVGFGLSTVGYGAKFQFLSQSLPGLTTLGEEVVWLNETFYNPTHSPPSAEELELKYLTDMVAKTNGFYARDYSLWLGWNNVRGSSMTYPRVFTIVIDALHHRDSSPSWPDTEPNNYHTLLCIRSRMRIRHVRQHFLQLMSVLF